MRKDLVVVCDMCRIKMSANSKDALQFITDHHVCDPDIGIRIVSTYAEKVISYLDVEIGE